jgi:hypothetical protein
MIGAAGTMFYNDERFASGSRVFRPQRGHRQEEVKSEKEIAEESSCGNKKILPKRVGT